MSEKVEQTQQRKKPSVNLNLQTDASITQNVVPAINSLELICNASHMQGIDGIDPNGFDGYGLSLDELNLLYSPTFEISPSEFNMNNGEATISALPSATNSLSGGLKPLSEEDEANNDPKAEDKLKIESVSDGEKKIPKRKYNKRTKKSSIFSFDGFDNISQDSPNSSESSAMSPSPTNKSNKDNFLLEASSTAYPPFDPRMIMQYLPGQVFDQNAYHRLPNPGSGFAFSNHFGSNDVSMGTDSSASLLPAGLTAPTQGYYPNPIPNHNPNQSIPYPENFSGQNYTPGIPPMLQDARYYPLANGMKSYPLNYGNYIYGGQLAQNPLLNQLTGHPQLPAQFHPNMFLPGGQLPHPGAPMLPNLLGSNTALPFMPDKDIEIGKGEGDTGKSTKSSFQKSDGDGLDDFMSISALEMLSIQMESDQQQLHQHQQQQQHYHQQQQLLLSQKAQLMQLTAQQNSYLDMMMMSPISSAISAQQTAATSKRRSKVTAQPSTKGKAAKGGSSGLMMKTDVGTNDNDNDEDDMFSPEKGNSFIGQVSHHSHNSHGHSGTLNEMATMAMVTSTSIKSTSRANNSLSSLSRRFVEYYGDSKTIPYISGLLNVTDFTESPANSCRVDGAAETMNVHVRRIYELIKILEILSLIEFTGGKRGKFSWKGTRDFVFCLGCLQNDAMAKFPSVATSNGLTAVTAAGSTEALLPSINKLHINALNAQATAYTADLLLNMKSNSPTNSSTLTITNQLNQSLSQQHVISSIRATVGIAATVDSDEEDESDPEDNKGKAKPAEVFAMLPPSHTGTGAKTLKPKRVVKLVSHDGVMEEDDGEGLVAMGKVSFEGGRIDIPSGSDTDIPVTMTPVVKLSEDGSSTKKRSKEATPRKVSKSKQPDFDQALQAAKQQQQQQGISEAPCSQPGANTGVSVNAAPQSASYSTYAGDHNEHFMMETICRNFLQLFLVGMNSFTMSFAVHTLIPMQENEQLEDYNKKNATKIRRVYDIANVLCSLNIVQKKHIPRAADLSSTSKKKDQKAELKVMVWGSYSPLVVRQHFLSKSDKLN